MFNNQLNKQYLEFIKTAGYNSSKDTLGTYFDNGMHRFSIMKTGTIYQCYLNEKSVNGWVLKKKSNNFFNFIDALRWILMIIQRGIK